MINLSNILSMKEVKEKLSELEINVEEIPLHKAIWFYEKQREIEWKDATMRRTC